MPVPRRTQEERSAATRELLLDATVECLVEHGYGGTTTLAVAERAGVSRGARAHHFPRRADLLAAAVEHLARRRLEEVEVRAALLPQSSDRRRLALDLLAEALSGPLYAATLELWVASRSDPDLRESLLPVEAQVTRSLTRLCEKYVTTDLALARHTVALLLGRGVTELLRPTSATARARALRSWERLVLDHESSPAVI